MQLFREKDELSMEDEIDMKVCFRANSKRMLYDLYLDRMELSEEYQETDIPLKRRF